MNRSIIAALLLVTVVILSASGAQAIVYPHKSLDGRDTCDYCHSMQGDGGVAIPLDKRSNACVTCHNVTGSAARMPIEVATESNRFGNGPKEGTQNSHNWTAKTPFATPSMATPPTSSLLVRSAVYPEIALTTQLTCIGCHDIKSDNNSGTYKPLLRLNNSGDQLCLDCHRSRDTASAVTGSHPISRNYSSVYKNNTTAYRKAPKNANSANHTSDLGRYLKNGNIVCTTCHGVHYSDSDSATFDNRSTAAGLNPTGFTASAGNLLRTDLRGATSDNLNICSNCHKETAQRNHNTHAQNVQCADCHSAHVDYYDEGVGPNAKLVRRYMNISTQYGAIRSQRAVFNGATSMWFKKADGTGACQSCHKVIPGPEVQAKYPSTHNLENAKNGDCTACHAHSSGFAFTGDCTGCHGQPPTSTANMAPGYTGNDNTSPHISHAGKGSYYSFACKECHYDGVNGANHNTTPKSYQSVFVESYGTVGTAAGYPNTTADYNATTKTCSTVYCHSNGAPRGVAIDYKSPAWNGTKGSIIGQPNECISCHGYGSTLTTNAHNRHVTDAGKNCNTCHQATVNTTGTIIDRSKHANATKDVAVLSPSLPGVSVASSFNSSDATCTNACHQNISRDAGGNKVYGDPIRPAKWDDALTGEAYCGSCHAAVPSTLAHPLHLTAVSGPKLGTAGCAQCHSMAPTGGGTTHVDGGDISVITQTTSCYPCHPAPASATWTNAASVTCQSCHVVTQSIVPHPGYKSYSAPLKDQFSVSGHGQAGTNYDLSRQCTACHSANAADGHLGVTSKRLTLANDNGLCNSCHNTGSSLPEAKTGLLSHTSFKKYTTAASNQVAAMCTACHDVHGTANNYMLKTEINGMSVSLKNISTGFIALEPGPDGKYHGLCQVCHTRTVAYRNSPVKFDGYTGLGTGHDRKWCLDCHKHKDPKATFAFEPVGGCNVCHGYPPAATEVGFKVHGNYSTAKLEDYAGGGGAHTVQGHLPSTLTVANGNSYSSCTSCHFEVTTGKHNQGGTTPFQPDKVEVVVDSKFKFNGNASITYDKLTGTCSNVSCHFQATPKWSPVKQ